MRLTEQQRTTRQLFRAFADLANFGSEKRLEILKDVQESLINNGWPSVAPLVTTNHSMLIRVMRQINEVATGSATQSEAICQIIVWSQKALDLAAYSVIAGPRSQKIFTKRGNTTSHTQSKNELGSGS